MILFHASLRQRSLKSKGTVGLMSFLNGSADKLDDVTGGVADEENPTGLVGADRDELARLSANDALIREQQQARSAFRANMRAKYSIKKS